MHPDDPAWWESRISTHLINPRAEVELVLLIDQFSTGCQPVLCRDRNGDTYCVKFANNPQGMQSLVVEQVAAQMAKLIDAPVLQPAIASVPQSWVGNRYGDENYTLRIPGALCHASPWIESVSGRREELRYERRDNNGFRIPRLVVLWEWLIGEDEQWLYDASSHHSVWSFDHGFWLTAGEADWAEGLLSRLVSVKAAPLSRLPVSSGQLLSALDDLEQVTPEQICHALSHIPLAWLPDPRIMDGLGWLLWRRKAFVTELLRSKGTRR